MNFKGQLPGMNSAKTQIKGTYPYLQKSQKKKCWPLLEVQGQAHHSCSVFLLGFRPQAPVVSLLSSSVQIFTFYSVNSFLPKYQHVAISSIVTTIKNLSLHLAPLQLPTYLFSFPSQTPPQNSPESFATQTMVIRPPLPISPGAYQNCRITSLLPFTLFT